MNEQDYLIAWGAYAIAGLGLMLVFWLMTGWMWRWLREPLRLIVFILLFTPTPVDPQNDLYAPAIGHRHHRAGCRVQGRQQRLARGL